MEVAQQFDQVVEFLASAKGEVRLAAAEIVGGLAEGEGFNEIFADASRRELVTKRLLRLVGDETASEAAVKALVILSGSPALAEELIGRNAVGRLAKEMMEHLSTRGEKGREKADNESTQLLEPNRAELCLMTLSNLSRSAEGRKQFLECDSLVGEEVEVQDSNRGAIFSRILGEYLERQRMVMGPDNKPVDKLSAAGSFMANMTIEKEVRALLIEHGVGVVNRLAFSILNKLRRKTTLMIFRHLANDVETHQFLSEENCTAIAYICCCVYPSKDSGKRKLEGDSASRLLKAGTMMCSMQKESEGEAMPAEEEEGERQTREGEETAVSEEVAQRRKVDDLIDGWAFGPVGCEDERQLVYDVLFQLAATKTGREGLRRVNAYEVFRVWHLVEPTERLKAALEEIVHLTVFSEHELEQQDHEQKV